MPPPVLDAHALMVYLEREAGFVTVRDLFAQALADHTLLPMTTVNIGEVLYIVRREYGAEKAAETENTIHILPIEIADVDLELAREPPASRPSRRCPMRTALPLPWPGNGRPN